MSKDADFSDSFILRRVPYKLLLVSTGNIRNPQLEALFLSNLELVVLVAHTVRFGEEEVIRIISARKATKAERKRYDEAIR